MPDPNLASGNARSPRMFFTWVFLASIPFWGLGAFWDIQFLPGLPVSSLMIIVPVAVAACLVYRRRGVAGVRAFLKQAFDVRRLRSWAWLVVLLTMPGVMLLSGFWQNLSGEGIPAFSFDPVQAIALFCLFFVAATAEELGWTGFATKPLIGSMGIFSTGLIIGFVAALWHIFPLLQAGRAWDWIAWWFLATISRRILIVWVYERGGQSVFGASLFHAMSNLSWMLFPVMGSHYDPMVTACILALVTAVALVISKFR